VQTSAKCGHTIVVNSLYHASNNALVSGHQFSYLDYCSRSQRFQGGDCGVGSETERFTWLRVFNVAVCALQSIWNHVNFQFLLHTSMC